jgi:hypothetical protein
MVDVQLDLRRSAIALHAHMGSVPKESQQIVWPDRLPIMVNAGHTNAVE